MELPSNIPSVHQISTCDVPLPYFPQTPTVAQWHPPNLNLPKVIRDRKACSVEQLKTVKKRKYISSSCKNDHFSFCKTIFKGFMTLEMSPAILLQKLL